MSIIIQSVLASILHISFHSGCINDFEGIGEELGVPVVSWNITKMDPYFFDPESTGNALYNLGHERAERIFEQHKEYFESFDLIVTSDTAPLSRIFLQHGWKKPLVIWICNRFDYCDRASLDCDFPDPEFYELFKAATKLPNVQIIPYNDFERYYCQTKGITIAPQTIKPSIEKIPECPVTSIPSHIDKGSTFFLPPYHNDPLLKIKCLELNIPCYSGRYNGPGDLKGFKGIIHLPYAWSNLAFFENMHLGIPYFIPTITFLQKLHEEAPYFFSESHYLFHLHLYELTEWYSEDFKEIITYFDSWEDLVRQTERTDFETLSEKIKQKSLDHRKKTVEQWKTLLGVLWKPY